MPESPLIEAQQQAGRRGRTEQSRVGARVEAAAQLRSPSGKADAATHLEARDARQGEFLGSGYARLRAIVACRAVSGDGQGGRDHLRRTVNHRTGVQVVEFEAVHERAVGQRSLAGRHAHAGSPHGGLGHAGLVHHQVADEPAPLGG